MPPYPAAARIGLSRPAIAKAGKPEDNAAPIEHPVSIALIQSVEARPTRPRCSRILRRYVHPKAQARHVFSNHARSLSKGEALNGPALRGSRVYSQRSKVAHEKTAPRIKTFWSPVATVIQVLQSPGNRRAAANNGRLIGAASLTDI